MGSSQLPEFMEHWVSVVGLDIAAAIVIFGVLMVVDSFRK